MPINLPPGVSLHPNSSTRNRVQPTGDFIPFSVRAAVGQTSDLFVAYASDGTTKLFRLESDGTPSCPGAGIQSERFGDGSLASGSVSLAVGHLAKALADGSVAVGRQAFVDTAYTNACAFGVNAVTVGASSLSVGTGSQTGDSSATALGGAANASGLNSTAVGAGSVVQAQDGVGVGPAVSVGASHLGSIAIGFLTATTAAQQCVIGGGSPVPVTAVYVGGVTQSSPRDFSLNATGGSGANVAGANLSLAGGRGTGSAVGGDIIVQSTYADGSGTILNSLHELARISQLGVLSLTQLTSIQDRTAFDVTPSWATATDASRKARTVFNVYDTVAREAFRIETNGSAAMLGFLGAAAVVQQPSTADLKDAWCGFGFQVNGGATPLNLDGGSMTAGNYASAIATKIANYTLTAADGTILGDATTGGFSVTLPTAVGITGRVYVVKKIDTGSNLVTVVPNGAETIDGSASAAIRIPETALALQSDGAVWRII